VNKKSWKNNHKRLRNSKEIQQSFRKKTYNYKQTSEILRKEDLLQTIETVLQVMALRIIRMTSSIHFRDPSIYKRNKKKLRPS
jgi:hypothetical protein